MLGTINQRKQGHACASGGFTENRHIVGIAAKDCDILMHPLQSLHLIQEPQILGVGIVLAVRQMGQTEKPENVHPVLDGNEDDIRVLPDEIGALLPRFSRRAKFKSAAVNPYHDRLLFPSVRRLPNIQKQAFFTLRVKGANLTGVALLAGRFPDVIRLVNAVVRHTVHRRFPTQFPDRLLPDEGNALEGNDVLGGLFTDKGAVDTLDGQRLVILSVGDLFVLTVQGLHSRSFPLCCVLVIHNTHCIILLSHFAVCRLPPPEAGETERRHWCLSVRGLFPRFSVNPN